MKVYILEVVGNPRANHGKVAPNSTIRTNDVLARLLNALQRTEQDIETSSQDLAIVILLPFSNLFALGCMLGRNRNVNRDPFRARFE
jgi:hypothetical protein